MGLEDNISEKFSARKFHVERLEIEVLATTAPLTSTSKIRNEILNPGHQSSAVFCFYFKNGLQNYEFLLFAECIYVFYTKTDSIRTLSA